MFVLDGAKEKVRMIRKEEFLTKDVNKLIEEAKN